jgi:hypothetical protein
MAGLAIWLVLACAIGLSGVLEKASAPAIAAIVWALTIALVLAGWKAAPVRDWASNVPLRGLISFHLIRFVGLYFLYLEGRGQMPAPFARPAGWGDVATALLATVLLVSGGVKSRGLVLAWNSFGFLDILFVVFCALQIGLRDWSAMHALREWPLNLLPTLVVPLVIASHLLIFARVGRSTETG